MSAPPPPFDPLLGLLRGILGPRLDDLPANQVQELAAFSLAAARSAVLARTGDAPGAAAALAFARDLARQARRQLALQTTPDSATTFVGRRWWPCLEVIEEHRARLRRIPGVVGFGPGFRRRTHARRPERCVIVYVRRKLPWRELLEEGRPPVPPVLHSRSGRSVPTDVVEFPYLHRHLGVGASLGPAAGHRRGTLGAFARDVVTDETVAITAMHVTGRKEGGGAPLEVLAPSRYEAGASHLGWLRRGTMRRIDAATVGVDAGIPLENAIPGIGPIRGWRPVDIPGDYDAAVRMWGARTRQIVRGSIVEPLTHLPHEGLESVILADIFSQDGDSGAALVDEDEHVLGFLVGQSPALGGVRVFTPVSLVLLLLSCDILTQR